MASEWRVIGRGWKNFEVQARKHLYDSEQTIRSYPAEGSEGEEKSRRESLNLLENSKVALNRMLVERWDSKGHSDEISNGNEEPVIGN